ncbi:MAG TPA: hypothetical protein VK868_15030, partial [Pyrinomonadaceae bacterium]|nr:hypothetical protein [Pyrinomonadaceae bacterium]
LACDMTAIPVEQRAGHLAKSRELFSQIQEARELSDGYEFRFAGDVVIREEVGGLTGLTGFSR